MIEPEVPRWLVTIAFVLAGAFCLHRCLRRGPTVGRIGSALNVLMCSGMIAMAWPAVMGVGRTAQLVVFCLATVWFVGLLVFGGSRRAHHGTPAALTHHAAMMAAMAWMLAVMPSVMGAGAVGGGHDQHGGHAMPAAPGSDGPPWHVAVVGTALGLFFLVAGIAWLARAISVVRAALPATGAATGPGSAVRSRALSPAVEAVMSLGMALMAVLMT